MRCLVTGGAGFIGSHTVDALIKKGHQVKILDNLSHPVHRGGKPCYLHKDAEFIIGDVCNKNDLKKALCNVDIVYHLAAYKEFISDFSKLFFVNCFGTALLYEVIVSEKLKIQKVIVASSQAVYGEGKYRCPRCNRIKFPGSRSLVQLERGECDILCETCRSKLQAMWTNENRVNPQTQYAISKYAQELISLSLGKHYHIPTCCLRYSAVQGARQSIYNGHSGICRVFCLSQFFDRQPPIYEDGRQTRDFVNVNDVVTANLVVLESQKADYKVFNVGGGKTYSVLEFASIASKIFDKNIEPQITGKFRYGDTRHIFSDISRLKELGWKPKFTPEESIREYINWLCEFEDLDKALKEIDDCMKKLNIIKNNVMTQEINKIFLKNSRIPLKRHTNINKIKN